MSVDPYTQTLMILLLAALGGIVLAALADQPAPTWWRRWRCQRTTRALHRRSRLRQHPYRVWALHAPDTAGPGVAQPRGTRPRRWNSGLGRNAIR